MKALSIIQPWATLLAVGAKKYETRSWSTRYRGTLAIHASAKPAKYGLMTFEDPWASRELLDAMMDYEIVPDDMTLGAVAELIAAPGTLPTGAVIGTVELMDIHRVTPMFRAGLTERELAFGDFTVGRYAWEIANPIVFDKPISARGAQGLWNWEVQGGKESYD